MTKLAVFDWNGCVFDDVEAMLHAQNEGRKVFGLDQIDLNEFQARFTRPIQDYFMIYGIELEAFCKKESEFFRTFFHAMSVQSEQMNLRAGAIEVLQRFRAAGYTTVLLSNHFENNIRYDLFKHGCTSSFDIISGRPNQQMDISEGVAKQDRLENILQELGDLSTSFSVGDEIDDIHMAQKFGIPAISISGGLVSKDRLIGAGADNIVDCFSELTPEVIAELTQKRGGPGPGLIHGS